MGSGKLQYHVPQIPSLIIQGPHYPSTRRQAHAVVFALLSGGEARDIDGLPILSLGLFRV